MAPRRLRRPPRPRRSASPTSCARSWRSRGPTDPAGAVLDLLTLQFLPYQLRGVLAGRQGLALFLVGAYRLVRALVDPFALWDRDQPMVEVIYQKRFLARGRRIVAIGGGTGLSTLLRGLKEHTSNLTAVVTVADDGGARPACSASSSASPRWATSATAWSRSRTPKPLMGRLLQYRSRVTGPGRAGAGQEAPPTRPRPVEGRRRRGGRLGGPRRGQLRSSRRSSRCSTATSRRGVGEMNRVLAVRGRVVPATGTVLTLHARLDDGTVVEGQSAHRPEPRGPRLGQPPDVRPTEDALRAIEEADVIVIGPGSLFTSLLPALLVPGIREAIAASGRSRRVRLQRGHPAGRDRRVRPRGPRRSAGAARGRPSAGRRPGQQPVQRARPGWLAGGAGPAALAAGHGVRPRLVLDDLVDPANAHHHDRIASRPRSSSAWEREGGRRRRPSPARVERSA